MSRSNALGRRSWRAEFWCKLKGPTWGLTRRPWRTQSLRGDADSVPSSRSCRNGPKWSRKINAHGVNRFQMAHMVTRKTRMRRETKMKRRRLLWGWPGNFQSVKWCTQRAGENGCGVCPRFFFGGQIHVGKRIAHQDTNSW